MPICRSCESDKPEAAFPTREGRPRSRCRVCTNEYQRANYRAAGSSRVASIIGLNKRYRRRLLEKVYQILRASSCIDCGEKDPIVLEFDHRDPAMKVFSISRAISHGFGWSRALAEMEKCDIRCANCHRRRTAIQFGWARALIADEKVHNDPPLSLGRPRRISTTTLKVPR